jgi:hypothetical protein
VSVWTTDERNQDSAIGFLQLSPMNYRDLRDKNEVFSGVAAHVGIPLNIAVTSGEPQQVFGEIVSGNYFSVLGAKAAVGRTFGPDEDRNPGEQLVAVLGYGEWQKRFGGDPGVVWCRWQRPVSLPACCSASVRPTRHIHRRPRSARRGCTRGELSAGRVSKHLDTSGPRDLHRVPLPHDCRDTA